MEGNNVTKAGRCFNGAHRDSGKIVHFVPDEEPSGFWGTKALCGTEPGVRGYGWTLSTKKVNCPKCNKKLTQQVKPLK